MTTPIKPPTRLKPIVTLDIKFFWDACDKGELKVERCAQCRKIRFPPRPMCPHCHSTQREHVAVSGRGKVYSWIRPVHPKPVGFDEPPIVALVELEEGFRLVSNLYGIEFEKISRDLPVELFFDKTVGGRQVPVFRPAGATVGAAAGAAAGTAAGAAVGAAVGAASAATRNR